MRTPIRILAISLSLLAVEGITRAGTDEILASLTPEEKVGQHLVIGIEGKRLGRAQRELLEYLKPGGVASSEGTSRIQFRSPGF